MDTGTTAVRDELERLVSRAERGELGPVAHLHRPDPATQNDYRPAAVLVVLTPTATPAAGPPGADIFLVQRSPLLRHHPGQIALPGGRRDPGDRDLVHTALRETHEEIGLRPQRVQILGTLPQLAVPVSRYAVSPVVGWCEDAEHRDHVPAEEVLHTLRVPVGSMLDPANRAMVELRGFASAGFTVPGGWVWGFTGNLLDHVFDELGWTRPWDRGRVHRMTLAEAHGDTLPPLTAEG